MPRLSEHLKGPALFIKRDDCTGLATGGNKTRKLEFLIGDAFAQNADIVVTQGAVQSNHVRQTAAAACKHGLECHALLERRVPHTGLQYETTGNVLLDRLFGATLEFRGPGLDMNAEARSVCDSLSAEGRRPYFIPGGGSNEIGALGYVACAQEIENQSRENDSGYDWIVMGTGSTGTQAGLVAGLHAIGSQTKVMGVSVRQPRERQTAAVLDLARRTLDKLGGGDLPENSVIVDDGYVGDGYGIPATSTIEAISLAARYEGVLLDPVYSGKGFSGLIGLIRDGFFKGTDKVLFLHTGGASALFAYESQLLDARSAEQKATA